MYYNIHTHSAKQEEQARSIVNIRLSDNLNLQHSTASMKYSAGIHPWEVNYKHLDKELNALKEFLSHPDAIAIGECGLDKKCDVPFEWQKVAFTEQAKLSEEIQLPMIIHCVKAVDEILHYKKELQPVQPWILHGFRGKREQMETLIKKGFYLSLGINYNPETLKNIDANRLFFETDDQRHSIQSVYSKASSDLGIPETELIKRIEENVSKVFYSLKK